MKKILFIVLMLFITGCSIQNINNITIDEALNIGLKSDSLKANIFNKGYKYYLPKGFLIYKNNLYNQTLISNGDKYYLNVDVVSYHNNTALYHNSKENSYYYKSFTNSNKEGYLEINEKNNYFFIEIMYNYAIIEVVVESDEINYAIINMLNILNSIEYNNVIIERAIGESVLTHKETIYEIEKPKVVTDEKNFLDYVEEYDKYEEPENTVKDEDKITE